jgi:triosephosphate isomerase (TIM)
MKSPATLFIANWKMAKPFSQAVEFCKNHRADLIKLAQREDITLAIAPDYIALDHLVQSFANTPINIGAQNCSSHQSGAYTGQVSAQSISETGADFCIIGHSESRKAYSLSNDDVAQAMFNVLRANMIPIICIGETLAEKNADTTHKILEKQLTPLFKKVQHAKAELVFIAYEPVWAIGTNQIPQSSEIESALNFIQQFWQSRSTTPIHLLYGGSVNSITIKDLKTIQFLNGFIIGSASLDFQELENIVDSYLK